VPPLRERRPDELVPTSTFLPTAARLGRRRWPTFWPVACDPVICFALRERAAARG